MKKSVILVILAFTGAALSGCGEDSDLSSSPATDREDCLPGDTLWVQDEEQFDLVLYNDLYDAAYVWTFTDGFSERTLEYTGYRLEPTVTEPHVYGAPVNEIFTYKAIRAGTACDCLELRRPFGDYPPAETKNIVIIVTR